MGDYNPHRPYVLGNEFVPIDELTYDLSVDRETGYTFLLPTATSVASGGFYCRPEKLSVSDAHFAQINVYPESAVVGVSGPIGQVIIPPNGGTLTGAAALSGASSIQDALTYLNDGKWVNIPGNATTDTNIIDVNFAFNAASGVLSGKRILNFEVMYALDLSISSGFNIDDVTELGGSLPFRIIRFGTTSEILGAVYTLTDDDNIIRTFSVGELDSSHNQIESGDLIVYYPWIYSNLQLFEPATAAGSRGSVRMTNIVLPPGGEISTATIRLRYMALRITYCEETRILTGARNNTGVTEASLIPLRSATTLAAGPTALAAGRYLVTITEPLLYDNLVTVTDIDSVNVNSVRRLNPLSSLRSVHINRTMTPQHEFQTQDTDQFVQIALLTSTGVVTGSHAYGTQILAPEHANTPILQQKIDHTGLPATPTYYPQVRFYARNFGDASHELEFRLFGSSTIVKQVTARELAALPELVDGWREVTLRFDSDTPSFAGPTGSSTWVWDNLDLPANQWQILGADAPSVTGVANLDVATYGGASNNFTWLGTADTSADAVLIFSQDPPGPTGLAVSTQTQAVTGVGAACGITHCIPTGIKYNRITWSPPSVTVLDTFTRTLASDWGTTTSGQTWTLTGAGGTILLTDWSVTGSKGRMSVPVANGSRSSAVTGFSVTDVEATGTVTSTITDVTGGSLEPINVEARRTVTGLSYLFRVERTTAEVIIAKLISPSGATLANVQVYSAAQWTPGEDLSFRVQLDQTHMRFRVWRTAVTEPTIWNVDVVDSEYVGPGDVVVRSGVAAGNTNAKPVLFDWDNISIVGVPSYFNRYELQRYDALEGEWSTIMSASSSATASFNDFEARVGVESRYRIRTCNELNFCGLWSAEVANTLPAPGATGADDGNSILIFTSNECQNGGANLAYVMSWDGAVEEAFTFAEAADVSFQKMYQRDFLAAFHPLERGGEQFSRNILVQAAAISPPSLGNFRSLRDLAWAGLPYVAVRDELGNRWFANVRVPEGRVTRNRTLYVARIDVVEVTDTPSPVDPGSQTCP